MTKLFHIDINKCNLSYSCIRICPVKAIKSHENNSEIINSRCIECGHCVTVCLQGAVKYRIEKETVRDLIRSDEKVSVICDPAIAGEFVDITDYRKFVAMIRRLGFDFVHEVAFGADLIAIKYKELYDDFKGKYYISSKCPAVINYVEMYQPELVDNIAPIVTPYIAMAKVVKKKYGDKTRVVYLTSCIAAKDDVKKFNKKDKLIDAVITFRELRELFKDNAITEKSVQYSDFDQPVGRKGGLFPLSHGLLEAGGISQILLEENVLITEGKTGMRKSIEEFAEGNLNQHIDTFYCHGCTMGPGMSPGGKKFMRRMEVINYVKKRVANLDIKMWEKNIDEYIDLDFSRSYMANDKRMLIPKEEEIEAVLSKMGKSNIKDQLGCGACGYPSCRDFAIAHVQGLANYEMCYVYSSKSLHSYINKLNETNEQLKKIQLALKKSEEKARKEEQLAKESAEIVTAMLNKLRAGVVLVDEEMRIIEANKKFVELLGEEVEIINETIPGLRDAELNKIIPFAKMFETVLNSGRDIPNRDITFKDSVFNISVFTIKKGKVVGGIIRDLTNPEVQRDEVIQRAQEVIKENLKTVQQIAYLLGESAVKTEQTLNSIIESQKLREK